MAANNILYGWYYTNAPLTQPQMESNAVLVKNYFTKTVKTSWAGQAIAAMLGNMQAESTVNPGRWENGDKDNPEVGYGLVQWTPATKFINWAGSTFNSGDTQCRRLEWERENGEQFAQLSVLPKFVNDALGIDRYWYEGDSSGPVDIPGINGFSNFAYMQGWPIVSYPGVYADLRSSIEYATWCFLLQYERPGDQNQPWRAEFALKWAEYLGVFRPLRMSPWLLKYLRQKKRPHKARKEMYLNGK